MSGRLLRSPLGRDRTFRTLLAVSFLDTLGRSAVLTILTLYLTTTVGLSATQAGLGLTIAGAAGVAGSLAGGHLADRVRPRRLVVGLHAAQGLALASYALIDGIGPLIAAACVALFAQEASASVRSTLIGRVFAADVRVRVRAIIRSVFNVGITLGTAAAAIPLALGTDAGYRVTLVAAGLVCVVSGLVAARIPDVAPGPDDETEPGDETEPAATARRRGVFRDARYLVFVGLVAVFTIQMAVLEIGMPLWLVHRTDAPEVAIAPLVLVNTVLVIALQVPLSRRIAGLAASRRAWTIAGALFAAACALYAAAALPGGLVTLAVFAGAVVFHSLGEIVFNAASAELGYELAAPASLGAYMGVLGMGSAVGSMVGPLAVTTAVSHGEIGWAALAALFLAGGAGILIVVRRARRGVVQPAK